MFFLLPLRILYFCCFVEVSLDFKLESFFFLKKKIPRNFSKHIVSDGQMELILKQKCTFIWCSYHFNTLFCIILQYRQSKREILCRKEKQYSVKLHDFCFRILCRMDIHFKRFIINQCGITMNIKNTWSVTVLSNLRFKLIFPVFKKSWNTFLYPT